jgi:hypothetical protein
MARRIEHHSQYGYPAERVYAALTDEDCLRERLSQVGGRRSELVSFTTSGGTTKAVMRQSIDAEHLPLVVRRITPRGVTIERVETWDSPLAGSTGEDGENRANGRYGGTIEAWVSGFSGSLRGTATLSDGAGTAGSSAGSVLVVDGEVKVGIPLVGGRIEAVVADQLGQLLNAEARFTNHWLGEHPA